MAQVKVELAGARGQQAAHRHDQSRRAHPGHAARAVAACETGYEVILFHAVGTGGRAMEQMMRQGLIGGVFDYALGEISDELHHALRAAAPTGSPPPASSACRR